MSEDLSKKKNHVRGNRKWKYTLSLSGTAGNSKKKSDKGPHVSCVFLDR